jgi:hypothetical protein
VPFSPSKKIPNANPNSLFKKLGDNDKNDLLAKLHDMRVKAFESREHKLDPAKPHLPALDTNERERIVEQFFEAKKKLNKL